MAMRTINPKELPVPKFHQYLLGAVTPRPIAFASTIDAQGNVNLSPFSFFNCFGANPPIVVFSPARRGRDNTTKHSYENVLEVPEVVINVVNYEMVQQQSLASTEYPKGVNEFVKAGFTEEPSVRVKPPRVKESPIQMECKVMQVLPTGQEGGAGILVICEVLLMHIREDVLDGEGRIDPYKLDAVARLGQDYYCRVQGESIFRVPRPLEKMAIGIDQLPESIRNSTILTGNDLGMLANVTHMPDSVRLKEFLQSPAAKNLHGLSRDALHGRIKELLLENKLEDAWDVVMFSLQ